MSDKVKIEAAFWLSIFNFFGKSLFCLLYSSCTYDFFCGELLTLILMYDIIQQKEMIVF